MELLLVDDDAIDRELFADAIGMVERGPTIEKAQNGAEAIRYLDATDRLPDLIILDLNMPVKDGRATLLHLKAHPRLGTYRSASCLRRVHRSMSKMPMLPEPIFFW